jgi:uncharacterized protein (DUF2141 family)
MFLVGMLLSFVLSPAFSQSRINVSINNLENNKGTCLVCLYNNAKDFSEKGGKPVQCSTVSIQNKTAADEFEQVKPGTYAIMVIHDANNNRKFDTNFLGIPKEGYGASQNKLPFAAAPKFEENKFVVTENSTVQCTIRLRYIL